MAVRIDKSMYVAVTFQVMYRKVYSAYGGEWLFRADVGAGSTVVAISHQEAIKIISTLGMVMVRQYDKARVYLCIYE